jgi:hypothetical protein
MKTVKIEIRVDFEETLTFEDLGLTEDETDQEVIDAQISKHLEEIHEAGCLDFEEIITIDD